jgi:DNA-directed RNA polymerase alpha subunit
MNPKIDNFTVENDMLKFTLSGVDVSFANAIRRIILSEIPIAGFKTIPYEENKCNILANTSRLNNEIIKQRLSCIPVHITDLTIPLNNYILEIDEENKTDTVMIITTEHFKVRNLTTNTYLEKHEVRKIFPPFIPSTGKGEYFVDFVRLRPTISPEIPGEKLKLTCEFTIVTAKEDSMFNVASTCSYGYTVDKEAVQRELPKLEQRFRDEGKSAEEIAFELKNWQLLEGMRYTLKNSFDFAIQTVGIYESIELVQKACKILINKFEDLKKLVTNDQVKIEKSISTIENCYDVTLENENYTIGNIINFIVYNEFYSSSKVLSYCGFKKMHPHDPDSLLRVGFNQATDTKDSVREMLIYSCDEANKVFKTVLERFQK